MNVQEQTAEYIASQPEPKRTEMQQLHGIVLALIPDDRLWFLEGRTRKAKPFPIQTLDMDFKA